MQTGMNVALLVVNVSRWREG